ncbi:MAG TPA: transposase [Bacteroidetes bacterium]|nr:transposase [Bacteroidota bacterium]
MQYFIGLKEFTTEPVFDPSLFVEIRKRIGKESFDKLNELLIKSVSWEKDQPAPKKKTKSKRRGTGKRRRTQKE